MAARVSLIAATADVFAVVSSADRSPIAASSAPSGVLKVAALAAAPVEIAV